MADDWEDTPVSNNACCSSNDGDNGKSFSKGRGFTPFEPDQGGANGASDGDWGGGGGRGGGRGRGGGGRGRGGRGGGGFRSERSDKFGDDDNDGDRQERGGGHERGGRGGGRGRGGFDGGDRNRDRGDRGSGEGGEDGAPEVKREIYIPPEPSNDENEMFGSAIESGINFGQYDKISVKVSGENVPKPIDSFEKSGIRPYILENIKKSGYTKPTPIQKNSIPIIMEGRDLMGCAQTGSGKTAAFLLPIINQLLSEPTDLIVTSEGCCQPHVVIVTPTRELTIQIYLEARKFAHGSVIKTNMAYGGTAVRYQADNISRGCHILVATPGRMHDFVGRNRISFDSIRFIVLDEADRMLDMGFMGDIEKMMDHPSMVPAGERQTLMFSATFPGDIQQLAGRFLHNYLFVAVGIVGGACTDVEQTFHEVNKYRKKDKLREILRECDNLKDRVLVFVEEKRNADFLAAFLSSEQFPTTSIHGGRLQRERELALADFKSGKHFILVATAVAARGLDIKNVSIVINFDLPKTIDEYVHRIGRTGRVGNRGKAISFFDMDKDNQLSGDLVRILKQAEQEVPSFLASAECGSFSSDAFGGRDIRNTNGTSTMVSTTDGNEPDDDW